MVSRPKFLTSTLTVVFALPQEPADGETTP